MSESKFKITFAPEEEIKNYGNYLTYLFFNANKLSKEYTEGYLTESQRQRILDNHPYIAIKAFKRKTLGICGFNSIKSLDEIANVLTEINVADDLEKAKEIAPNFVKAFKQCNLKLRNKINSDYLSLTEVKNLQGDIKYRISYNYFK